jgi:hypothetical protein
MHQIKQYSNLTYLRNGIFTLLPLEDEINGIDILSRPSTGSSKLADKVIVGCPTKWVPPPDGVIKVNCDGGFCSADRTGATGAVPRDSAGSFMGALARWLPATPSALVAEAEACRDDVRLAVKGIRRVVIETDSLELVSLWKNKRQQRSEVTIILHDIQELAIDLDLFDWVHTRRLVNVAAHLCAKHASLYFLFLCGTMSHLAFLLLHFLVTVFRVMNE